MKAAFGIIGRPTQAWQVVLTTSHCIEKLQDDIAYRPGTHFEPTIRP